MFGAVTPAHEPWVDLSSELSIDPKDVACSSLHAPDVVVDDDKRILYMFVHGHGCRVGSVQPTFVYFSHDGLRWQPLLTEVGEKPNIQGATPTRYDGLFYTRIIYIQGSYYLFGKSQEDAIGYLTVVRRTSFFGPFSVPRKRLLRGVRHFSLALKNKKLYIFLTLITATPKNHLYP